MPRNLSMHLRNISVMGQSMSKYQDKIYCVVIFMAINNAKLTQINFCQFKNKHMFPIQGQAHGSTFMTRKKLRLTE